MSTNNEPLPRTLSKITRGIRLYDDDDKALMLLQKKIFEVSGLTITDLVRDSINAGRSVIERRWKPIIDMAAKEK